MQKCISIPFIALIYTFLVAGESPSGRGPNPSSGDYLLIHNSRRFCEGPTILHATDEIKVEDALDRCDSMESCSFYCQTRDKAYTRAAVVGRPRRLSKTENVIPRSSVSWLCSGGGWNGLFVKKGWTTGVKGDAIRKVSKEYDFGMNQSAECETGHLLDIAKGLGVKECIMR